MAAPERAQLRAMMERHFGVALDRYPCMASLQMEIDAKMRTGQAEQLDAWWYKQVLAVGYANRLSVERAMLRARCDQHNAALQQTVRQKWPAAQAARPLPG